MATKKKKSATKKKTTSRTKRAAPTKQSSSQTHTKRVVHRTDTYTIVWLVLAIVVVLALMILFASNARDDIVVVDKEPTSSEVTQTYVTVSDSRLQLGQLTIDEYSLPQPAFIVAHLALPSGERGVIVGQSDLLDGRGGPARMVIGGTQAGKEVLLSIYVDDGNGRFEISRDTLNTQYSKYIVLS